MKIKIEEVLGYLENQEFQYSFEGNRDTVLNSFSSINKIKNNCISWIKNIHLFDLSSLEHVQDVVIVCNFYNNAGKSPELNFIFCENPKEVFFSILKYFFPVDKYENFISPKATVESDMIGKGVYIGHNSYIGKDVSIGNHVIIKNNVCLEGRVEIGNYSIVHSGVVIGKDGFGYYQDSAGINKKVPHYGGVIIGEHVEIGSNTCIDRGTLEDTEIKDNVKISSLCHISHNVIIGKNVLVTAGTIITGSSKVGESTYIAPGSIIRNQLKIGNNSFIGMGSVVVRDVEENVTVVGVPAKKIKDKR